MISLKFTQEFVHIMFLGISLNSFLYHSVLGTCSKITVFWLVAIDLYLEYGVVFADILIQLIFDT